MTEIGFALYYTEDKVYLLVNLNETYDVLTEHIHIMSLSISNWTWWYRTNDQSKVAPANICTIELFNNQRQTFIMSGCKIIVLYD